MSSWLFGSYGLLQLEVLMGVHCEEQACVESSSHQSYMRPLNCVLICLWWCCCRLYEIAGISFQDHLTRCKRHGDTCRELMRAKAAATALVLTIPEGLAAKARPKLRDSEEQELKALTRELAGTALDTGPSAGATDEYHWCGVQGAAASDNHDAMMYHASRMSPAGLGKKLAKRLLPFQ